MTPFTFRTLMLDIHQAISRMGTIESTAKKDMTDTRTFKTVAWTHQGIVKVFWGLNHHRRAVDWLSAH